jgi:hypothetical protein
VTLGAIAGVASGLGLAAVAGARRTATAFERFRVATAAPDAIVFATQIGIHDQDYSAVAALPEVLDAGAFTLAPIGIEGHLVETLPPGDDHLVQTLSQPLLVHGRLPDPARADELLVNRAAAARFHFHVGQRVTLVSATDLAAFYTAAHTPISGGPTLPATIVGIGDSAMDQAFFPDQPSFTPSAGFLARFPEVPRAPNLVVRLRPGTDVAAFRTRVAAALGLPDIPVRDLGEDHKRVLHGTDLERTGLLLFAGAVLVAAVVLVGQALTRTVDAVAEPIPTLRALGLTARSLVGGAALPFVITAVTAAVVAVVGAVAFSVRFPVGLAGRLEPDPGFHADWAVLVPGAVLVALLVLAGAALGAYRATAAASVARDVAPAPSYLRRIFSTAPLPVAIGVSLALERGRGDRALPVRPALAGAIVGVVGVVGALGLVRGIDDAIARPIRAGQVWDADLFQTVEHHRQALIDELRQEPDADAVAELDRVPLDVDGTGLPVYTLRPVQGAMSFAVLSGRAPSRPGEALIAPASAKALGKHVGDHLQVGGPNGLDLAIVGTVLLPQTPHASFDQGVWAIPEDVAQVDDRDPELVDTQFVIRARPGARPTAFLAHLRDLYGDVEPSELPQDVRFLGNVRTLPRALALFLALLAVAALGHALVLAVSRRRHDFAVLKALGFRPAQNAACIAWQATTVAVVGLVVGLPLGIIAGRLSWRWVAEATPLLYVPPVAAVAVVLAVPTWLLTANVLALVPARRAARLRTADVLRSE